MDNALNKLDEVYARKPKIELYRDNFQNYKRYGIPKAQLIIADIPYNIGADAYGSNPMWYKKTETIRTKKANLQKQAFSILTDILK